MPVLDASCALYAIVGIVGLALVPAAATAISRPKAASAPPADS